ncbi:MAG: hypothetical protein AAGF15_02435 [Pseudomonadota bacterium]
MKIYAYISVVVLILTGCSASATGIEQNISQLEQSIHVEGNSLLMKNCKLYRVHDEEKELLYNFDDYQSCFLMQDSGKVRLFNTQSGMVVPLGISRDKLDYCETWGFSLLVEKTRIAISTHYYSRKQCSDFKWPEKPFHVLATEVLDLPA